jgi:Tfp pilus assembly protein PilE
MTVPELIAVIVAGVLFLLFAVTRFRAMGERGDVEAMRATLRRLAVAQDSYQYDHGVYAGDLAPLGARGFRASPPVEVQIVEATRIGWSGTVSHTATATRCHLFVKTAAPVGAATEPGEIVCG